METLKVGDVVTYVTPKGREVPALITANWSQPGQADKETSLNLVWVSEDEERNDQYGRQIERDTSIVNEANQSAPGNYWKRR